MAGAARDVARHGLGDVAMLEGQSIGCGMGVHRSVPPRLRWEGDHQLNGIPLPVGSCLPSRTNPSSLCTAMPR
jgi:hypothetical protein